MKAALRRLRAKRLSQRTQYLLWAMGEGFGRDHALSLMIGDPFMLGSFADAEGWFWFVVRVPVTVSMIWWLAHCVLGEDF